MKWSEAEELIRNKFGPIDSEAIIDAHDHAIWDARSDGKSEGYLQGSGYWDNGG